MKLIYDHTDSSERPQLGNLVHALLKTFSGQEMDGIEARNRVKDMFGVDIDHHEFTYMMDNMTRTGEAVCTQGWGMTRYRIL